MEPWLKTTTDDMFILNMDDILTMSESNDFEMISMYQKYVRKAQSRGDETNNHQVLDRDTGLLSNVHDAKELLEKLYTKPSLSTLTTRFYRDIAYLSSIPYML